MKQASDPAPSALAGKRVILTRAAGKNDALAARIAEAGGLPFIFPTIASAPVADDHLIREAVAHLDRYAFIVFTSAEAVEYFTRYRATLPPSEQLRYAAVGSATAEALRARGVADVLVPDDFRAEGLVKLFTNIALELKRTGVMPMTADRPAPAHGHRAPPKVLIPRALVAREVLPQALEQLGFDVTVAPLYETVLPKVDPAALRRIMRTDAEGYQHLACDAVVFMSPSAVKNFAILIEQGSAPVAVTGAAALLAATKSYSIGAPTTAALRRLGVPDARIHQAAQATTDALFTLLQH